MTSEEKKLLKETPYFIVYSKKTNAPFINKADTLYLYGSKIEAENFIRSLPDAFIKEDNEEITDLAPFYRLGFKKIMVRKPREKAITIELTKDDVKQQYYDPDLNRCILKTKHFNKNEDLRSIKKKKVFTPVCIEPRKKGEYPKLFYAQAKDKKNNIYYFIFSTIEEFDTWKKNNQEFEAMEIRFDEVNELFKDSILIINPLSTKLIISQKEIKKVFLKEKK